MFPLGCQDGWTYLDPEGEVRAAIVFDNPIHRDEMPVTIDVFVDPAEPDNRNAEYDASSDAQATFPLTEIVPDVQDRYLVTDDPIGGRPPRWEQRRKPCVLRRPDAARPGPASLSFLGSVAQLRRGHE